MNIDALAKLGQVYTGCTTASGLCTGLSTTYTGLCIYNPFGSGVSLLMFDFCAAASAAPATFGELMISVSSSISATAPATNTSAGLIAAAKTGGGSGLSKANLFTITTLPVVNVNYKVVPGSLTTGALTGPTFYSKFDGSLIVVPGTGVMVSFTTTAINAQYSFTWAEVNAVSLT
jgi:hypothetical protein